VLNTAKVLGLLLIIFRIIQGSVVTQLMCGGKCDTCLVPNLLLSPTVKEFFLNRPTFVGKVINKIMNEYRFFMDHGVFSIYSSRRPIINSQRPVSDIFVVSIRPIS